LGGKRLDIPSYIVRVGDAITLTEGARKFKFVAAAVAGADKRPIASWLDVDRANFTGNVKGPPAREDVNEPEIREQLVVEYYSR
jgi:small subunit ribosomal protein S4